MTSGGVKMFVAASGRGMGHYCKTKIGLLGQECVASGSTCSQTCRVLGQESLRWPTWVGQSRSV